jgi:membrane protease YdiL (CAAX protease family)
MSTNTNSINKYALPLFLILTPLLGNAIALFSGLPVEVIVLTAAFIPAVLAVVLVGLGDGRKALGSLLRKPFQGRVPFKWYIVALGLPLVMHLSIGLLAFLLGWIPAFQLNSITVQQVILGIVILLLVSLEELGWRGFVLPRLLVRQSAVVSAVVIGIFWGLFHLGLGVADGRPLVPTFLVPFISSIIFTWLFVQTEGKLLLVILFHLGFNFFPMLIGGLSVEQSLWLQTIVNLVTAVVLIFSFGPNLQRSIASQSAVLQPNLEN